MTRCIKVLYKNSLSTIKKAVKKSLVITIDTPCTYRNLHSDGGLEMLEKQIEKSPEEWYGWIHRRYLSTQKSTEIQTS